MILHPISQIPIISFVKIRENAEWFKDFLEKENINISSNNFIQRSLKLALELETWSRSNDDYLQEFTLNSILSQSIGISYLISVLREAYSSKYFNNVKRLLKYFSTADPVFHYTGESTQQRNFLFELEIASLFLCCGHEVFSANEPDVIVKEFKSSSWDIPCKMIYSDNPVTMADRIDDGIGQCLSHESDYGLVVAGLSNITDHSIFLPMLDEENDVWGSYVNTEVAMNRLGNYIKDCFEMIQQQSLNHFSRGRENTKFRGIILIAHTICSVNAVPMTLTQVALIQRKDLYSIDVKGPELDFCKRMNDCAQTIFPA